MICKGACPGVRVQLAAWGHRPSSGTCQACGPAREKESWGFKDTQVVCQGGWASPDWEPIHL